MSLKYDNIKDLISMYESLKRDKSLLIGKKKETLVELENLKKEILEKKNIIIKIKEDWNFYSSEIDRFLKTIITIGNVLEISERNKLSTEIDKTLNILTLLETRLK